MGYWKASCQALLVEFVMVGIKLYEDIGGVGETEEVIMEVNHASQSGDIYCSPVHKP